MQVTNRSTGQRGYKLFNDALRRLQGTQIETNITTGGKEEMDLFSFIDRARTVKETRDGRMEAIEITLSDWVFNAINEKGRDILTISRDYFRLRKPLERRLYEIAASFISWFTLFPGTQAPLGYPVLYALHTEPARTAIRPRVCSHTTHGNEDLKCKLLFRDHEGCRNSA